MNDVDSINPSSPKVDPATLQPKESPIKNAAQAFANAKRYEYARRVANKKNAEVQSVYNGAPPFKDDGLASTGQGWRANYSTKSLATVIDRSTPAYISLIEAERYLTSSSLPADTEASDKKSETFQRQFTKLVQSWTGFRDFLGDLFTENNLFGYAATCRMDPYEWRPKALRQDKFYVAENCPQDANKCAEFYAKDTLHPYELLRQVQDRDAATTAGWNVDNVVKAVNGAEPEKTAGNGDLEPRTVEDNIKQDTLSTSSGPNTAKPIVVETWNCLYTEFDGQVSQRILHRNDGYELFFKKNAFPQMADATTFFAIQSGNGRLYGSLGQGRSLVNIAISIERNRCRFDDAVQNATKIIVHCAERDKNKVAIKVQGPFVVVTTKGTIAAQTFAVPLKEFQALDGQLMNFMEVISGSYLPSQASDGTDQKTAREVTITAMREDSIRGALLARAGAQFNQCIGGMQRSACHPENILAAMKLMEARKSAALVMPAKLKSAMETLIAGLPESAAKTKPALSDFNIPSHLDVEAVEFCADLLADGLQPHEILLIAYSPAKDLFGDSPAAKTQRIAAAVQMGTGDENIDQDKLRKIKWTGTVGPEMADDLILPPKTVPTTAMEAQRAQSQETAAIMAGMTIGVSPRDEHFNHRASIKQDVGQLIQGFTAAKADPPPQMLHSLTGILEHFDGHLKGGAAAGENPETLKTDEAWKKEAVGLLDKVAENSQKAAPPQPGAAGAPAAPGAAPAAPAGGEAEAQDGAKNLTALATAKKAGLIITTEQEDGAMVQMGLPPIPPDQAAPFTAPAAPSAAPTVAPGGAPAPAHIGPGGGAMSPVEHPKRGPGGGVMTPITLPQPGQGGLPIDRPADPNTPTTTPYPTTP